NCGAADQSVADYRELRKQWKDKGVAFMMMNSAGTDDLKSVRATAEKNALDFPIMLDNTQLIAEGLKISKAGEVVVLDPAKMTIAYRGPVSSHIGMTLDQVVAGK